MKSLPLVIAALAIPASVALAQTTPSTSDGTLPYIPLIPSSGPSSGAGSATWFIDTARNMVVLCARTGSGATVTSQSFSCAAQQIPGTSAGDGSGGNGDQGNAGGDTDNNGGNGGTPSPSSAGTNPFGG